MTSYTLIELVMAVSLLVIVLVGGTAIFYRSFRSSGISDIQTGLNNGMRSLGDMIENSLRYGTVVRVVGDSGDMYRTDCLSAGTTGVSGSSMVLKDNSGAPLIYSLLADGTVSSNSGEIISQPSLTVNQLLFTWICRSGVNDKINLLIEATSNTISGEIVSGTLNRDINLLNSGIN
jgi:hypothetical protein